MASWALAACSAYHAARHRTRLTPPSTKLTDAAAADRYYERGYAVAHLNARGDAGSLFELPNAVQCKSDGAKDDKRRAATCACFSGAGRTRRTS